MNMRMHGFLVSYLFSSALLVPLGSDQAPCREVHHGQRFFLLPLGLVPARSRSPHCQHLCSAHLLAAVSSCAFGSFVHLYSALQGLSDIRVHFLDGVSQLCVQLCRVLVHVAVVGTTHFLNRNNQKSTRPTSLTSHTHPGCDDGDLFSEAPHTCSCISWSVFLHLGGIYVRRLATLASWTTRNSQISRRCGRCE